MYHHSTANTFYLKRNFFVWMNVYWFSLFDLSLHVEHGSVIFVLNFCFELSVPQSGHVHFIMTQKARHYKMTYPPPHLTSPPLPKCGKDTVCTWPSARKKTSTLSNWLFKTIVHIGLHSYRCYTDLIVKLVWQYDNTVNRNLSFLCVQHKLYISIHMPVIISFSSAGQHKYISRAYSPAKAMCCYSFFQY